MRIPALGALAFCLLAAPAHADLEYAFNVTSSSGALQPFSFSFTSAAFLANNDVPIFTPFTVTNSSDSWTLTQGLVTQNSGGNGCFEFGTASGVLNNNCNVGTDGSDQSAALLLELKVALPTAPGVYDFMAGNFIWDTSFVFDLTGSLDITAIAAVPEPASIGLLGIVLAFAVWKLSKRYVDAHCDGKV